MTIPDHIKRIREMLSKAEGKTPREVHWHGELARLCSALEVAERVLEQIATTPSFSVKFQATRRAREARAEIAKILEGK